MPLHCSEKASGQCAGRVLQRPYWDVTSRILGLHRDEGSRSCVLSLAYQPVRNVAAAEALAGAARSATFLLFFDFSKSCRMSDRGVTA